MIPMDRWFAYLVGVTKKITAIRPYVTSRENLATMATVPNLNVVHATLAGNKRNYIHASFTFNTSSFSKRGRSPSRDKTSIFMLLLVRSFQLLFSIQDWANL